MEPPPVLAIVAAIVGLVLVVISVVVLVLRAAGRSQKISMRGVQGNVNVGDVAGDVTQSYTAHGNGGEEPPPKRDWVVWITLVVGIVSMVSGVVSTFVTLRGAGGS